MLLTLLQHLNDITPGCFTNRSTNFLEVIECKDDSESRRNVMLEMSSLRVIVKRSRGKNQQEETVKQQHVIVTENKLFKGFTTKGIQNYY